MKKILAFATFLLIIPQFIFAHCPLCTIGAGAAGGLAVWLGVSQGVVGIFIGAFGFAIGLVTAKKFRKVPAYLLGLLAFVLTVLPVAGLFRDVYGLFIPFLGEYGEVININQFLLGSVVGVLVLIFSPFVSKKIKKIRGKTFQFQTMLITFGLLFLVSVIAEIFIF